MMEAPDITSAVLARNASIQAAYDAIPYPSLSYAQTHPDTLATVARLAGLSPAPVERCRVLELGTGSGGNLLPMAEALPDSTFIGIDLSARQIEVGRQVVDALGLKNIALRAESILDIGADYGTFDYIIAHGVYSWVPRAVQDKILSICRTNLAPQGVAYVSYNCFPGWKMLGAIRDMLLYRTRDIDEPMVKAAHARDMLNFVSDALQKSNGAHSLLMSSYATFLQRELEHIHEAGDAYLLHDELEQINEPLYFHEFATRLAEHELQYLADAEMRTGMASQFTPEVSERLQKISRDAVELEQYMDFMTNRMFRRSLLCHAEIEPERRITPEQIGAFCVASHADEEEAKAGERSATFKGGDGSAFASDTPITIAAMRELRRVWPRSLRFDELLDRARAEVARALPEFVTQRATDYRNLGANLLQAFVHSPQLVELHTYAPSMATQVAERPQALALARHQAVYAEKITNLYHERVQLAPLARAVLPLLDGTRNRPALIDALMTGPIADGLLTLTDKEATITDPVALRSGVEDELEQCLAWLAYAAVLVN
ncbi:MAG: methyltransferase regulatory domain-containing protein [Chloroflexi bacterium]|nr:methyltransferase regulatory domain-containing protein [Chloroflexota bacterium]